MAAHGKEFSFYGGHLALDFANTKSWRLGDSPQEHIETLDDLLSWCRQAQSLSPARIAAIRQSLGGDESQRERTLERAVARRETLYRLFEARMHGREPDPSDLSSFNGLLAALDSRLEWSGGRYRWRKLREGDAADEILEPIVRAGAELLASDLAAKVSQCQDDRGCGWLFLDRSRGKARRWCSMADCGNRAKARRFYQRTARSRSPTAGSPRRERSPECGTGSY